MRRLAAAGASLIAALALATPGFAAEPKTSLNDIEDEVMCPVCGTALGLSGSPQADRQRIYIQRLIDRGRTKQQIKDALVAEYGREVLAVPEDEGFDLAAWLVPALGIAAAAIALLFGVRRWRRRTPTAEAPPPPPLPAADAERLDADLARYD